MPRVRQTTLVDPPGSGIYLVCGVPESKEFMRDERLAKPSEFPYAVLITLKTDCINVFQEYGNALRLRSARSIVRWLLDQTQSRIEDEYRNDWTERVAQQGVGVLYPQQLQ